MHPADVEVERFDEHSGRIVVNGQRFRLITATHGPIHLVEVDGVTHRVSLDEGGVVRSPAPALVVATPLSVGDEVGPGAPILVLESMKMETVLRAPFRARVRECRVSVGSQVEAGAPLLRLEPLAAEDGPGRGGNSAQDAPPASAAEIDLPAPPTDIPADQLARQNLEGLRGLLLGFDGDAQDRTRLLTGYLAAREVLGGGPAAGELEVLTVFADLSELSRIKPGRDLETEPGSAVHSPREYFYSYLQSLDVERAGRAGQLPGQAGADAWPLRRHQPGALAGTGDRRLPDLPGPAADGWPCRHRQRAAAAVAGERAADGAAA